jgi:hypothetical protein
MEKVAVKFADSLGAVAQTEDEAGPAGIARQA